MSIYVMTDVFRYSQSRLADRLVLLVIADKSDHDGTGCFRGRESIAQMAGVSPRQVSRSIAALIDLGELESTERPGQSNLYKVTLDKSATPPAEVSRDPGQVRLGTLDNLSTNTSSDTSSDSSAISSSKEEPWKQRLLDEGGPVKALPPDFFENLRTR